MAHSETGGVPERSNLPPWTVVYDDLLSAFAERKSHTIKRMWDDEGRLERDQLVSNARVRLDDSLWWMAACREIHERAGVGYREADPGQDFRVTWPPAQWNMTTAMEILIQHQTGYPTANEWRDTDDGGSESYVVVRHPD